MARRIAERADTLAPLAEVFREHGYEGASLTLIGKASGLGKGSLYHFFPGGKDEMLSAVLADVDAWFETNVYAPLRTSKGSDGVIDAMFDAVDSYFRSGRRVCLLVRLPSATPATNLPSPSLIISRVGLRRLSCCFNVKVAMKQMHAFSLRRRCSPYRGPLYWRALSMTLLYSSGR